MSKRRLRARDRRALLLGLAILAPAAAYRAGVAPWLEYRSGLADALLAERDLYARERAALADAAANPERESSLRAALAEAEPWLVNRGSSIAASGVLSRRMTDLGRDVGILIQDVQAGAVPESTSPIQSTSVTVRATGDLEGIARFLHAIESGSMLLEVRELTLRVAGVNDGDLERGQLLSAGIVVEGIWGPPTPPESAQ